MARAREERNLQDAFFILMLSANRDIGIVEAEAKGGSQMKRG